MKIHVHYKDGAYTKEDTIICKHYLFNNEFLTCTKVEQVNEEKYSTELEVEFKAPAFDILKVIAITKYDDVKNSNYAVNEIVETFEKMQPIEV